MTRDAVVVVPGIMGSTLVDVESGATLWGLNSAGWYVSAWTTGAGLERLRVTDAERAGKTGRVKATGVLKVAPVFAPVLGGLEPYRDLLAGLRRVVAHPDAVAEFGYDWRLSVEHNARGLAEAAEAHLRMWRAHREGSADAQLVLVAHSMGGLLARYFTQVLGGAGDVRVTLTLGTPYYGAVKAAHILAAGRGAPVPLPHRRLRAMARTMPGVHDLLPFYRCIDEDTTARRLTPADAAAFGGDADLARESIARHEALMGGPPGALRLLVGVKQPTMQSMRLSGGTVTPLLHECVVEAGGRITARVNKAGDSTVYRGAAAAFGLSPATAPQSHGALPATAEVVAHACDVLLNDTAGPPLRGLTELGLDVPDVVPLGQPLPITVTGAPAAAVSCRVLDAFTNKQVARPPLTTRGGGASLSGSVVPPGEGVFRVEVKAGGSSAVTRQVMVVSDLGLAEAED